MPMKSILLLGSNLDNPLEQLSKAIMLIEELVDTCTPSSIYKTAAWGNTEQNDFYNQGLLIETDIEPNDLMKKLIEIEVKMGRTRLNKWEPRIIDIDIIAIEDNIIKTDNLEVPHPHMQNRMFVLIPMNELAPNWIHPVLGKNMSTLISECEDDLSVTKLDYNTYK